jgi:hypothetical protein
MMNDEVKPNQYKKKTDFSRFWTGHGVSHTFLRLARFAAVICILSLAAIYAHDVVVQSPFFMIREVSVFGNHRTEKQEILALAGLSEPANIFEVNLFTMGKRINSHPWIATASVHRSLFSTLTITIVEQQPLAIVRIENLPDMLINAQGVPFKEFDPVRDRDVSLPVITGLDLTHTENISHFEGPLFDAVLDLLHGHPDNRILSIEADGLTGITIQIPDRFSQFPGAENQVLPVCLGFDNYNKKLIRARQISQYIFANIPGKTICAIDLFDIDTVFVKTKDMDDLHANIEKGV